MALVMSNELTPPSVPALSVIVPTYRRFGPVLDTVGDLLAQRGVTFEVIVADQNPEWPAERLGERDALRADPRVRWLELHPPAVVTARNEAVRQSRGDILAFVDDDVRISDPQFLARHAANYRDPAVAAVAGRELRPVDPPPAAGPLEEPSAPGVDGRPWLQTVLGFDRRTGARRVWACVFSTCNCSVRRDVFLALGGFDENFAGNSYGDDSDFVLRMHARGWRSVYDPHAALVHLSAPAGGLRLSDRQNRTSHTDRVLSGWLFYLRHARPGWHVRVLHTQVLRRTIFLRANVVRPWRQIGAWMGLLRGYAEAKRRLRHGIVSRFCTAGSAARGRSPGGRE
jgi:GT2 family glycosyltransferase